MCSRGAGWVMHAPCVSAVQIKLTSFTAVIAIFLDFVSDMVAKNNKLEAPKGHS